MIEYANMTKEQKAVYNFSAFVMRIITNYDMYKRLGEYENNTQILSKTARYFFFESLFDLLQRDFYLESAKILEDPITFNKGKKNYNLTVKYFIDMYGWKKEQKDNLIDFYNKLHEFHKGIKAPRNKIIGHNDLEVYIDGECENLGGFEEGKDAQFVKTLEDFYNYLYEITFGGIWGSFTPNVEAGGIQELIAFLYQGLAFEEIVNDDKISRKIKMLLIEKNLELKGF